MKDPLQNTDQSEGVIQPFILLINIMSTYLKRFVETLKSSAISWLVNLII